jgi:hypothetical protein
VGPIKKNQLNVALWKKKITSNSLRKNKTLISPTPTQLAFQMAFSHWNIHD